jgi:hypothetical protein
MRNLGGCLPSLAVIFALIIVIKVSEYFGWLGPSPPLMEGSCQEDRTSDFDDAMDCVYIGPEKIAHIPNTPTISEERAICAHTVPKLFASFTDDDLLFLAKMHDQERYKIAFVCPDGKWRVKVDIGSSSWFGHSWIYLPGRKMVPWR